MSVQCTSRWGAPGKWRKIARESTLFHFLTSHYCLMFGFQTLNCFFNLSNLTLLPIITAFQSGAYVNLFKKTTLEIVCLRVVISWIMKILKLYSSSLVLRSCFWMIIQFLFSLYLFFSGRVSWIYVFLWHDHFRSDFGLNDIIDILK